VEQAGVKDTHKYFVYTQVVTMENVEAVRHHTETKVAGGVTLVTEIIFIKVDLSEM